MSAAQATVPWLIGVEIGGTKLQVGLGRSNGKIDHIRRATVDVTGGAKAILAQIDREVDLVLALAEVPKSQLGAIGIGFGGPVDAARGVALKSHHVDGWDGFNFTNWCRTTLRIPVVRVENDADTAALGEARHGAGRGKNPLLYVTIGSGIGAGLIIDGQIYRGAGLGAAELGHLWLEPPTGKFAGRIIEDTASGWSIGRIARERLTQAPQDGRTLRDLTEGDLEQVNAEVIALAAGLGDPLSIAVLDEARRALSLGLSHAIALLAPARIILGGGVALIGEELWFAPIRAHLEVMAFAPFRSQFDLVPAKLGQDVVVHGALALAEDAWRLAKAEKS
jgi:glucokinase